MEDTTTEEIKNKSLTFCLLASGSRGNAIYISGGGTSILVDAGMSGIELERRMAKRGLSPRNLDAIVVSHEHNDHIHGVGVLSRRYGLPVYMSRKTARAASSHLKHIEETVYFESGTNFTIDSLSIHPFSTSHDADDPSGFTISLRHNTLGIATDLGIATAMVKTRLKGCQALILEANHDPEMLINGPYPWPLKQRVKSRSGHLSNQNARDLIGELQHESLFHVVLAHLSETNNTPEKALNTVCPAIRSKQTRLTAAIQKACSELFIIGSDT